MQARKVALHGSRRGAAVALAIAQVCSGHDLHLVEPSFTEGEALDNYQDLVEDFEGVGDAVANITWAEEVINNVFLSP
jgi:hypothetical protein